MKKLLTKVTAAQLLIIMLLIGMMLVMGIVSGNAVKESHVTGTVMTSLDGDAVQVDVVPIEGYNHCHKGCYNGPELHAL